MDSSHFLIRRTNSDLPGQPAGVTDLVELWLTQLDRDVRAGQLARDTATTYQRGLAKFQTWGQERLALGEAVDRATVLEWVASLRERRLSSKTIAVWLAGVRAFFQWGVAHGHFPADPTAGVKPGRRVNTRRHVREQLADEEVARLLSLASLNKRDKALIWLMLYSAARAIELQRADLADLRDTKDGMLFYVQGKGHSEKDEPLVIAARAAREAIRDYRAELAERGHRNGPLFVTERQFQGAYRRISRRTLRRIVKTAFRRAGIIEPAKSTHSLRHTALSKALHNGADIRQVQRLARHASQATTEIYLHERERLANPAEQFIRFGFEEERAVPVDQNSGRKL